MLNFEFLPMPKKFLITGFLFAALSVIMGAFAAHGLQKYLENGLMDEHSMKVFETAARYQMYHALAIILGVIIAKLSGFNKFHKISLWLFIAGIIFFSGSLYLLSTDKILGIDPETSGWKWLGPVTPIGGLCFISGWIFLGVATLKENKQ